MTCPHPPESLQNGQVERYVRFYCTSCKRTVLLDTTRAL